VVFEPGYRQSWDDYITLQDALRDLFQREVDVVLKKLLDNPYLHTLWIQRVVERNLEILGEAARRVSKEFQQAHPEIDWRNTVELRNIIAHRYNRVNHENLWSIVTQALPDMLQHLSQWFNSASIDDLE
jgi:uncharacterized protein with HEPN domain